MSGETSQFDDNRMNKGRVRDNSLETRSLDMATDRVVKLVGKFAKLVGEKGTGAVMAGIGAVIIIVVTVDQLDTNVLAPVETVGGLIAGTVLMVIGASIRIYASKLSMHSALETRRLNSEERLEQLRIEADRAIATREIEREKETKVAQLVSEEREKQKKHEGGTQPPPPVD